jgi:hypothetical protein
MGTELADGWRPLAAGLTDGRVLLVASDKCLAIVVQKYFAAGVTITKAPMSVLRALLATQGLHIVSDADKAALDAIKDGTGAVTLDSVFQHMCRLAKAAGLATHVDFTRAAP